MSIAPYYREAIEGQRAKFPLKIFKKKEVLIVASPTMDVASEEFLVMGLKETVAKKIQVVMRNNEVAARNYEVVARNYYVIARKT